MRWFVAPFAIPFLLAGCGQRGEGSAQTHTQENPMAPVSLTCLEFVTPDDQSVFNSTGVIRGGAILSDKAEKECTGRKLSKVAIQN